MTFTKNSVPVTIKIKALASVIFIVIVYLAVDSQLFGDAGAEKFHREATDKNGSPVYAVVTNAQNFEMDYEVKGTTSKKIILDLSIDGNYASLSVFSDGQLLLDNLDVPLPGNNSYNALVNFDSVGVKKLKFVGRGSDIEITQIRFEEGVLGIPNFKDISGEVGFVTENTFKYGGPSVGDVNNDGLYDFVLNNHNHVPTQVVTNNGDGSVSIEGLFSYPLDFHGTALGDYDADGDLDIMVALGGANGTNPTSYSLMRNDRGTFKNVSNEAGINAPARGRSPRWVDLDLDGKLDLILFNAKTPDDSGPQQLFYRNNGDGHFRQIRIPGLEDQNAERLLVTDFNGDGNDDILSFSPIALWQGNGDFTFSDVTTQWLPEHVRGAGQALAVADVDVNNDGLVDIYVARGKPHYQLSEKSIDFNPITQRLDIRDNGEKGITEISFSADSFIRLSRLNLTFRQYSGDFPIFLGAGKTRNVVNATGFMPVQIPAEMASANDTLTIAQKDAAGWPESRDQNGLYIGHIGGGKWKAEWVRNKAIYWNVSFTLQGLRDVAFNWTPNNRSVQDMLLVNQGDRFVDSALQWNLPTGGNHWGVTHGDFNNDGWNDLFVHRYGFLHERISDLVLINTGEGKFVATTAHGASDAHDAGHGDMGQAFDFDKDGRVDLLNGSEEEGRWYLYKNASQAAGNYILVDVGYSPQGKIDPISAVVVVTMVSGKRYVKRIGSAGEAFSQSLIDTVHFGIGNETKIKNVQVKWRNGELVQLNNLEANHLYNVGANGNQVSLAIE